MLFQALKIYSISRISFRDLQTLPGIATQPVATDSSNSNSNSNSNLPIPPKNGVTAAVTALPKAG
jgi:hypothetical protein